MANCLSVNLCKIEFDDKEYQDADIDYLQKNMLITEEDIDKPKPAKKKKKTTKKSTLEYFC